MPSTVPGPSRSIRETVAVAVGWALNPHTCWWGSHISSRFAVLAALSVATGTELSSRCWDLEACDSSLPTAQPAASRLPLCWAGAGRGVGQPGGEAFPWNILVPLQQALPGAG